MLVKNELCKLLKLNYPIWQAPLPFHLFHSDYSYQISQAGALGMLTVEPNDSVAQIKTMFADSKENIGVCFTHQLPKYTSKLSQEDCLSLSNTFKETIEPGDDFLTLFDEVLSQHPQIIGFAHGIPEKKMIQDIHSEHILTFAICRNLLEALAADDYDIDIIVLQGVEAGGEQCGFDNDLPNQRMPISSLLQQVRNVTSKPIVAWGDFTTGKDIISAFLLGAQSVMLDRALLACNSSGLSTEQYDQLRDASEFDSQLSEQFSAHPMRFLSLETPLPTPNIEVNQRYPAYKAYFNKHPESVPLSVSISQTTIWKDLAQFLRQAEREIREIIS